MTAVNRKQGKGKGSVLGKDTGKGSGQGKGSEMGKGKGNVMDTNSIECKGPLLCNTPPSTIDSCVHAHRVLYSS